MKLIQIRIVEPGDYGPLEIEEDKDLCTLLTWYAIRDQHTEIAGSGKENCEPCR